MQLPPGLREAHMCVAWEQGLLAFDSQPPGAWPVTHVVFPGRRTGMPGPDFRDAVFIDHQGQVVYGDVEVHLESAGWTAHGHQRDASYNRVALHVTWSAAEPVRLASGRAVPTLAIRDVLTVSVDALIAMPGMNRPANPTQCPAYMAKLPAPELVVELNRLGTDRLQNKANRLESDGAFAGFDGAVWAALLRALGYRANSESMSRLATIVPWASVQAVVVSGDVDDLIALLLGAGGWLEANGTRITDLHPSAAGEWRTRWAQFGAYLFGDALPVNAWTLGGVRPANHPVKRLMAAAVLAWRWREGWTPAIRETISDANALFRELPASNVTGKQVQVGESRRRDLAVNVLLPAALVDARRTGNRELEELAMKQYASLRSGDGNEVSRHMQRTLGLAAGDVRFAVTEQGSLTLFDEWCRERRCWECPIGNLARAEGAAIRGQSSNGCVAMVEKDQA